MTSKTLSSALFLLAIVGHLFLLSVITVWNIWVDPSQVVPRILPVIALGVPLLLFLRGLLRRSSKAYQLSCLAAMVYLALGITNIAGGDEWYGGLQLFGSVLWFTGSVLSLKFPNR